MLHGTIVGTILFLIALGVCISGVYVYKKSHKVLDGYVWLMLSAAFTMCYGALIAGVIDLIRIPVNLYSMTVIYAIFGGVLWYLTRKSGKRQEYKWEKFDIIAMVLITVSVGAVLMSIFTPSLRYAYFNSDAGLHLKEATAVVRSQKLFGMYFIHLQNALVIEMIQPFVKVVDWYKGYILADCLFLWFETLFFFGMMKKFIQGLSSKIWSLVILAAYFMGYPFMSFYYSFVYWALGGMLVGFVLLAMRAYEEAEIDRKYAVLMLMLGCFGVMTCYMLFAPAAFVATFCCLIIVARREGRVFSLKNLLLALKVFLIPTVFGGYYCLYGFFFSSGTSIQSAIGNSGGIYTELYMDFFWVLFPVGFMIAYTLKKKKLQTDIVFFLIFFGFTAGMLLLTLTHHASTYYYYKTYFTLWMLCFLLTFQAVTIMLKEAKETLIGYSLVVALLAGLCFSGFEYKVVTSREKITGALHSQEFFTLMQNNISFISRPHTGQDPEKMKLYDYVIKELADEKMVPLMTEDNDYGETYFYEGVSGYDFPDFYEWRHTEKELKQAYVNWNVHYTVLLKGSDFDAQHGDAFLNRSDVKIAYETKAGYILEVTDPALWGESPLK